VNVVTFGFVTTTDGIIPLVVMLFSSAMVVEKGVILGGIHKKF
jgi:hypothetical protein